MMNRFLTILILLTFSIGSSNVFAQEEDLVNQSSERIILITSEHCQLLTPHIPDDDVNYKPDEDVRGNSVVPAEIKSGNRLSIGERGYSFYMTHDALKGLSADQRSGLTGNEEGKIILGQVTVKDGDVFWNGTSLKQAERDRVYMLCEQDRRGKRRPMIKR